MKRFAYAGVLSVLFVGATFGQIYSNAPLVSNPGAGFGGADASIIQAPGTTFGPTASPAFRLADDFTVPCGESWLINSLTAYGYNTQPAAGPFSLISTLTAGNYRIWSGKPSLGTSVILNDFSGASQMTSTAFTSIYKCTATTLLNQQRPIFDMVMMGNAIVLGPGTYWLDYQITGSAATFTPYPSIPGMLENGNGTAVQFNGTIWTDALLDAGQYQGLPFLVDHTNTVLPCYTFDVLQPGGPGTFLTLSGLNGVPFDTAVNAITLSGAGFPTGWFFGLNLSIAELVGILTGGPPFVVTLDGAGGYSLPVGPIPPLGITVYWVGIDISGATVVHADAAKSILL